MGWRERWRLRAERKTWLAHYQLESTRLMVEEQKLNIKLQKLELKMMKRQEKVRKKKPYYIK